MNSDQLLRNLDDCAKASTHEPDAETINAAIVRIRELEAQLAAAERDAWNAAIEAACDRETANLTIDEKNERIAQLEAQLAAVKEAFSKFDKSKWTFTTGDGLQAYHELVDALSK